MGKQENASATDLRLITLVLLNRTLRDLESVLKLRGMNKAEQGKILKSAEAAGVSKSGKRCQDLRLYTRITIVASCRWKSTAEGPCDATECEPW